MLPQGLSMIDDQPLCTFAVFSSNLYGFCSSYLDYGVIKRPMIDNMIIIIYLSSC